MKKLIAIAASLIAAMSFVNAGEYGDITIPELKKAIEKKSVIVLDVNGSESFKKGHVPTAINYAAGNEKLEKALAGKDRGTLVVAYCGGPSCAAYKKGADKATALGFKNVKHLSAGISGWVKAGEKTQACSKCEKSGECKKSKKSEDCKKCDKAPATTNS